MGVIDKLKSVVEDADTNPSVEQRHEIAAVWWAGFLTAEDVDHDNGSAPRDLFGEALSSWAREKIHGDGYDKETATEFVGHLAKGIAQHEAETFRPEAYIGTDYHPGPVLKSACEAVDISPGMTLFPKKTSMWVSPGGIKVKTGHRSDIETIWTPD